MKNLSIILSLALFTTYVVAQPVKLDNAKSKMEILGTSSIHDWESDVEEFSATANVSDGAIRDIAFRAKVKSIKSGKSGMDSNTYEALNASDYPEITFSAAELVIQGDQLVGKGKLTIAGKTNEVPVNLKISNASAISVNGGIMIKMTDYNVTPPTAVFGTIKTGNEITIQLNFTLINI